MSQTYENVPFGTIAVWLLLFCWYWICAMALSHGRLITETWLLLGERLLIVERVTELQGDNQASTLSYSSSQFGWKMPHRMVVCLERVPNKALSHKWIISHRRRDDCAPAGSKYIPLLSFPLCRDKSWLEWHRLWLGLWWLQREERDVKGEDRGGWMLHWWGTEHLGGGV